MDDNNCLISSTVVMENINKMFSVGLIFRKRQLHVLQGINLQLTSGSIYGLLGPSGCGKTSLLKCIVGRLQPDMGSVKVFGHKPGSPESGIPGNKVGYMPQDIGLTEELTIFETLNYFGKTSGMSTTLIKHRSNTLLKLLHLDKFRNNLIGNLSGGQKRRVSFAVALFHQPPLLILDEPTVGLDPIMRQNIWEHLMSVVSTSDTSIIITTHYIEEAKNADRVGLMLNGKLVAQGNPTALISKHKCSTLEDVFLAVSQQLKDSEEDDTKCLISEKHFKKIEDVIEKDNLASVVTSPISRSKQDNGYRCGNRQQLKSGMQLAIVRFFALVMKTIIFSTRNPASIVLEVVVPPLLLTTFALAVGKPLFDLHIGVLNDDLELGPMYLKNIDRHIINLVDYSDHNKAMEDYKNGVVWGVIRINSNFTEAILKKTTHGILTNNQTLHDSLIQVDLDTSNSQVAIVVHNELLQTYLRFTKNFMNRQGLNPELSSLPLRVNGKEESENFNYNQFLMPGFVLSLTYFTAISSTSMNRAAEKQMGCTERLCVAGVTAIDLVFSELFVHLLLFVVEAILDFIVLFYIFDFTCQGSMLLALIMVILHGVCGMSFGIMVSAFTDYVATAMIVCIAVFFIGIMLQGVLWPLEGVPYALRYISMALTTTMPTQGMRDIINRGWGLSYLTVCMGYIMSLVWSVIFLSASLIAFHLRL